MKNSLKGRPVQAPIFEGKVPPQFVALFNIWLSLRERLIRRNQLHLFKYLELEFTLIRHYKLKRRERSKVQIKECTKKRGIEESKTET
ncbi:hypothetical protein ISN45_Aa06g028410 [Arabidopsis thaliana x Arabidopsis arenosa]|uniref:Uncharacterized protein n=1 Tax=Arabidopsis thaliana x Arabidopsis arenosa TaxID=1240361 RepID=A0A8T1Z269_9BRAS|nr:hypothetical protein ISN45_Aa06g028410 [Arabidopsis thaliana x Arabidopsis arenosa]